MFEARTLADIQQEFHTFLLEQNSQLTDVNPGSLLYTLSRSFAATQLQTDMLLNDLTSSFYLDTVSGADLDRRATDYSLTRKPGARATGYVLGISRAEGFNVPQGTIFTDPVTNLQFEVGLDQSGNIPVSSFSEVRIPITCTTAGELGNLNAGTRLITPLFPQGSFVVASHRTSGGALCGDLIGGLNPESDEGLRLRIRQTILFSRSTSEQAIRSVLLAEASVPWVALRYPKPGIIQVWIDNPSQIPATELYRLKQIVETVKPAGIPVVTTHQAERLLTDINIHILPTQDADLQQLTRTVVGLTNNYLVTLGLGRTFIRTELLQQFSNITGIVKVDLLLPTANVTPGEFQVVRSEKVWVTYETR